ncbi:hypothetical protein Hanom_Chr16g01486751 [Helianthus anomalus]
MLEDFIYLLFYKYRNEKRERCQKLACLPYYTNHLFILKEKIIDKILGYSMGPIDSYLQSIFLFF